MATVANQGGVAGIRIRLVTQPKPKNSSCDKLSLMKPHPTRPVRYRESCNHWSLRFFDQLYKDGHDNLYSTKGMIGSSRGASKPNLVERSTCVRTNSWTSVGSASDRYLTVSISVIFEVEIEPNRLIFSCLQIRTLTTIVLVLPQAMPRNLHRLEVGTVALHQR